MNIGRLAYENITFYSYRFGYHEPPINSVDHLHLHCLVLPITKVYIEKIVYGSLLSSTETVIKKIKEKKSENGTEKEKIQKDPEEVPKL